MIETTSVDGTRRDEDGGAKADDVRVTATKAASKHGRLMSSARDGRVLSALMLPFFTVRPPSGYGVLTTTGRRTGKTRRKCIRVVRRGNKAYLVSLRLPGQALSETVDLFDYGECSLYLRGVPTRAKIRELHGYWFDTGVPLVIELRDRR